MGSIPFRGISNDEKDFQAVRDNYQGRNLFRHAKNLTSVGSFLDRSRDADWDDARGPAGFFMESAFEDSGAITFPEGSLDTSGLTSISSNAFAAMFKNSKVSKFPDGSWHTEGMGAPNGFMSNFAEGSQVTQMPEGSLKMKPATTEISDNYLLQAFKDTPLRSLPAGSFRFDNITDVRAGLLNEAFMNTRLTELPEGSFNVSKMESTIYSATTTGYAFMSAFMNTPLKSLPAGSFEFASYRSVMNPSNPTQYLRASRYLLTDAFSGTQLGFDDAIRVLSKANLTPGDLAGVSPAPTSGNLKQTFKGTPSVAGVVTEANLPHLTNPIDTKNTFQGTNACAENVAKYPGWGLIECPQALFVNGADDVVGTVRPIVGYPTQKLPLPTADGLLRDGYTFAGWEAPDQTAMNAGDTYLLAKTNVTFKALWTKDAPAVEVTPQAPRATDVTCNVRPKLVIPNQEGVIYAQKSAGSDKVTVTATAAPGYVIADKATTSWTIDLSIKPCLAPVSLQVHRHSGPDRYGTSRAVNQWTKNIGAPVFIATGEVFPDALTVGPAITKEKGSLVLTRGSSLSPDASATIADLKPSHVYIIGEVNTISKTTEKQIKAKVGKNVTVERIGGVDRYETSARVFQRFFAGKADFTSKAAIVATGTKYPDALVSSAVGGAISSPVILVRGNSRDSEVAAVIQSLKANGVTTVHIAGGEASVSRRIALTFKDSFDTERHSGIDRYETSEKLNAFLDSKTDANKVKHVWLATGMVFPDALSASVPAGSPDARLFLSPQSCIPAAALDPALKRANTMEQHLHITGGTAYLSTSIEKLTRCS